MCRLTRWIYYKNCFFRHVKILPVPSMTTFNTRHVFVYFYNTTNVIVKSQNKALLHLSEYINDRISSPVCFSPLFVTTFSFFSRSVLSLNRVLSFSIVVVDAQSICVNDSPCRCTSSDLFSFLTHTL